MLLRLVQRRLLLCRRRFQPGGNCLLLSRALRGHFPGHRLFCGGLLRLYGPKIVRQDAALPLRGEPRPGLVQGQPVGQRFPPLRPVGPPEGNFRPGGDHRPQLGAFSPESGLRRPFQQPLGLPQHLLPALQARVVQGEEVPHLLPVRPVFMLKDHQRLIPHPAVYIASPGGVPVLQARIVIEPGKDALHTVHLPEHSGAHPALVKARAGPVGEALTAQVVLKALLVQNPQQLGRSLEIACALRHRHLGEITLPDHGAQAGLRHFVPLDRLRA